MELQGALEAVTGRVFDKLQFVNALDNKDEDYSFDREKYNQALQYLVLDNESSISLEELQAAGARAALVSGIFQIQAAVQVTDSNNGAGTGSRYDALCEAALQDPSLFNEMTQSSSASWCLRVRKYDNLHFGPKRSRSMQHEQQALLALEPLLRKFKGPVDLKDPDCKLYVLDGLLPVHQKSPQLVLAREIVLGPKLSFLDPNTRLCVTNTPLCPVVAYCLCNIARVKDDSAILDPYVGSGTILLAASSMSRNVQSVGIDVAHNGLVNRDDIYRDFTHRNLYPPKSLLHGDCLEGSVRSLARSVLSKQRPFDCIVTDPPYGIRESQIARSPTHDLLEMIQTDRDTHQRLLKVGGRLVLFVPDPRNEANAETDIMTLLPDQVAMERVGLELEFCCEQPLNDFLSRWLVCFVCVR